MNRKPAQRFKHWGLKLMFILLITISVTLVTL